MANRYWVGGTGVWSDAANRWSDTSGGTPNAAFLPTSADDVFFDANSNVGTGAFTVTVDGTSASPSICNSFSTGGAGGALDGAMTLTLIAAGALDCYGSMTFPAASMSITGGAGSFFRFKSTTTGNTFTTNGVSLPGNVGVVFDGVGGEWTLGSALSMSATSGIITVINGSFNTGNYNVSATRIALSGTAAKTISLGSSTVTCGGAAAWTFSVTTGLTFNAGTSTIVCSAASATFTGGSQTYYNVTFSNATAGTATISGSNTYNNLTFTSRSATGIRLISFDADQIVSGALTFGTANTAVRRIQVSSNTIGTQRTITLNGSLAALADVDFRDIAAAGSVTTPWTGTRLGNGGNLSGITTDVAKTVYWNLAGTQNWSATGWATTNNGTPAADNFPLPQDTATFTEAGAAGTITLDASWWIGSIQMADGVSNRTTAFTLATAATTPAITGSLTFFSGLTLSGTGVITFAGQNTSQTVTSATKIFTQPITVNAPGGTLSFTDAATVSGAFTFTAGTVKLKESATTTVGTFATSGTSPKYLQSGLAGTQATLSQASGTVNATYLTIQDIAATGGATWNALYSNNNFDGGNNTGWTFGTPIASAINSEYRLRSFTQPRRF